MARVPPETPVRALLETWGERGAFEAMVVTVGGATLAAQLEQQRGARLELEHVLDPPQRVAYGTYVDAAVDAASVREAAVTRVALAHGIGMGAALAAFPGASPGPVAATSAAVTSAILGSGLSMEMARDVTRVVIATLFRAEGVAT